MSDEMPEEVYPDVEIKSVEEVRDELVAGMAPCEVGEECLSVCHNCQLAWSVIKILDNVALLPDGKYAIIDSKIKRIMG